MEIILFIAGGGIYAVIEIMWRGYTHWSMFLLGGLCFVIMGLLNEHFFPWRLSFPVQVFISTATVTAFEFITGCIVNLWLGWHVWDYSGLPFNLLGQICLYYTLCWIPLSVIGIILDDWLRYLFYLILQRYIPHMQEREKPHYILFKLKQKEN